jgi:hypothetical protein
VTINRYEPFRVIRFIREIGDSDRGGQGRARINLILSIVSIHVQSVRPAAKWILRFRAGLWC